MEVREWTCSHCHTLHDRDLNAAINILRQGIAELYKVTPAELAGEGHGEDVSLEVGISPLIADEVSNVTPMCDINYPRLIIIFSLFSAVIGSCIIIIF
jgi:Putative transposase DNA-binding domain